jgi:hypothetical protein
LSNVCNANRCGKFQANGARKFSPPQFIAQIPHDIINGEPLHYRRTDEGQFVLYSVSWNETDDGGVVGMTDGKTPVTDLNKGDWVWRYPSK